jgi:hypothetical protein
MWRSTRAVVMLPSLLVGPGCAKPAPAPDVAPAGAAEAGPAAGGRPAYCWLAFGPGAPPRVLVTYDGRTLRLEDRAAGGPGETVFAAPADCRRFAVADPDGRTGYVVRGVEDMGFVADLGRGLAIEVEVTGPVPYWQGAQVRLGEAADRAPVVHFHAPLTLGPYASVRATPGRRLEWHPNPAPRLVRGERAVLGVQVGNQDPRPDCHVAVSSTDPTGQTSRFPATARPVAEIEFPAGEPGGGPVRRRYVLDKVCCGSRFYAPVGVPAGAGVGVARVTLSFEGWDAGRVRPAVIEVPVADPSPADD